MDKTARTPSRPVWALWLAAFVVLTVGGVIYLAFRQQDMLLFMVSDALGLGPSIDALRDMMAPLRPDVPWVLYALPDGLWTLSSILCMTALWHPDVRRQRLWALPIPAVGIGSELLQAIGWMPGVFDVADLLCYLTATLVGYAVMFAFDYLPPYSR